MPPVDDVALLGAPVLVVACSTAEVVPPVVMWLGLLALAEKVVTRWVRPGRAVLVAVAEVIAGAPGGIDRRGRC